MVPRGSGTGLSGGSVPVANVIVLCLVKMERVLDLDQKNFTILVQAGVVTQKIADLAAKVGLLYPPDPGQMKISTIGGNVAENSGGLRGLKYGVTRAYVMGMEVVLACGKVVGLGSKCVKVVAGTVEQYERVHALAPDTVPPVLALAELYTRFGVADCALPLIHELREQITNLPATNGQEVQLSLLEADCWLTLTNSPSARLNRAFSLPVSGDLSAAEREYLELEKAGVLPGLVNYGLAEIAAQRYDTNQIVHHL